MSFIGNPALTIDIRLAGADGVAGAVQKIRAQFASLKDTLSAGFQLNLGAQLANSILQAAAAFPRAISEGLHYAAALKDMAVQSGLTAEGLQVLGHAAEQSGGSMEGIRMALTNLRQATVGALTGNEQLAAAFKKLGVNAEELSKLPLTEQLETVARAFVASGDDAEAFSALITLLGERNVPQLRGMLQELAERGLGGLSDKLRETGGLLSKEMIEKADEMDDRWGELGKKFKKVFAEIGVGLKPLIEMFQWLLDKGLSILESLWSGFQRLANAMGALAAVLTGSNWKDAMNAMIALEREQRGHTAGSDVRGAAQPGVTPSLGTKGSVVAKVEVEDPMVRFARLMEAQKSLTQLRADQLAALAKAQKEYDRIAAEGNARQNVDAKALVSASNDIIEAKMKIADIDAKLAADWQKQVDATETIRRIEQSMWPLEEQRAAAAERLAAAEERHNAVFKTDANGNIRFDLEEATRTQLELVKAKRELYDIQQRIDAQNKPEKQEPPPVPVEGYFSKELRARTLSGISALSDGIAGLITGTRQWGEMWRSVGLQIIQSLIQMTVQALVFRTIMAAAPGFGAFLGIASIFAAGGGSFVTNGPTQFTVGDNPGGVELVNVIPLSGKGQTKVNGQNVAMAGGGTALVGGGSGKGGAINGGTFYIDNSNADAAGVARLEAMIMALNGTIEHRALSVIFEARRRRFGGFR